MEVHVKLGSNLVPRRSFRGMLIAFAWMCMLSLTMPHAVHGAEDGDLKFKNVKIYFIDQSACAVCDTASEFLRKVAAKDDWLDVSVMHIETSEKAQRVYRMLLKVFGMTTLDFPITVIGGHAVMGYVDHQSTGMEIIYHANYCRFFECANILDAIDEDDAAFREVRMSTAASRPVRAAATRRLHGRTGAQTWSRPVVAGCWSQ